LELVNVILNSIVTFTKRAREIEKAREKRATQLKVRSKTITRENQD